MSTESPFDEIIARIKEKTGVKSMRKLAEIIGKDHSTISAAKKKNVFPASWAYEVGKKYGVSTEWIMTGKGEVLREGNQKEKTEEKTSEIEELKKKIARERKRFTGSESKNYRPARKNYRIASPSRINGASCPWYRQCCPFVANKN